jgi:CRP/FNR family nitrogen fixation transcriptional regulator
MFLDAVSTLLSVTELEPDAMLLLEQIGTTIDVPRDFEFYTEGQPAEYCYRVLNGCIRTVRTMEDGRRHVGQFPMRGDRFGFDALDAYYCSAEAVSNAVVRRYPRVLVDGMSENYPALARCLRELALAELRAAHDQNMLLGRKSASERVASFVLDMESKCGKAGGGRLELAMGRVDIADHLGLTVETVCRVLAVMKKEHVVAIGRTTIEVRNRRALQALACDTRH